MHIQNLNSFIQVPFELCLKSYLYNTFKADIVIEKMYNITKKKIFNKFKSGLSYVIKYLNYLFSIFTAEWHFFIKMYNYNLY